MAKSQNMCGELELNTCMGDEWVSVETDGSRHSWEYLKAKMRLGTGVHVSSKEKTKEQRHLSYLQEKDS